MEYNDPNSPQYKLLETEFCQAVSAAESCVHLSSLFSTSLLSLPVTILTLCFPDRCYVYSQRLSDANRIQRL